MVFSLKGENIPLTLERGPYRLRDYGANLTAFCTHNQQVAGFSAI